MNDPVTPSNKTRWQRFRSAIVDILKQKDPPKRIARGMAIGIFVGFLPIMSIQMAVSTMIAIPCRGNLKAAIAGVWITNPLTFIPFYYGCYRFGLLLLPSNEVEWDQFKTALVHTSEWSWSNIRESLGNIVDIGIDILAPLWLGSTVLGIIFGVATYFATLAAVRRFQKGSIQPN